MSGRTLRDRAALASRVRSPFSRRGARKQELLGCGLRWRAFPAGACARGAIVTSLDVGENLLAQVAQRCDSTRRRQRARAALRGCNIRHRALDGGHRAHDRPVARSPRVCARDQARADGGRHFPVPGLAAGGEASQRPPLASLPRVREFVWPHVAKQELERSSIDVNRLIGFNLLPLFRRAFEPFHSLGDRAGVLVPFLCVNSAVRGTKRL